MSKGGKCGYPMSELDCKILMDQIARRAKYRQEFLRAKSDPCKHSREAGYVFDDAMQRFVSMKVTHFDHFKATFGSSLFGLAVIVAPMLTYGYLIWTQRQKKEHLIRCGDIKYRDRNFKLG